MYSYHAVITYIINRLSDEVRKRQREALPPISHQKPMKRPKQLSPIDRSHSDDVVSKTQSTIEALSYRPVPDPLEQYNLIQQIIGADISDPLLLADIITRRPELGFLYVVPRAERSSVHYSLWSLRVVENVRADQE